MIKHKLEWYMSDTNTFIYDKDVIKLLKPKLNKAKICLKGIEDLIYSAKEEGLDKGSLTSKYLEYSDLLSLIYESLDTYFHH